MQIKTESYVSDKTILSRPVGYEAINIQVSTSVKAGEIYPANDGTAIGIIFNDVDVASGDTATVALLKKGYVNSARLLSGGVAATMSVEAQAVLPMIVVEDLL